MLKTLDGVDSKQAQLALSSLTRALLPSPSEGSMEQRVKALPALQREVLSEICERLGLGSDLPASEELPAVLESLTQEMSNAALSKADIDDLATRTFQADPDLEKTRERSKPRIFISSSVEGLKYARAIEHYLESYALTQIWDEQRFDFGRSVLDSLIRNASGFDFAILLLTADDVGDIRARSRGFARSNVAFEAGLFVGRLGARRTFFIAPKDSSTLAFVSDLAGMTTVTYDRQVLSADTAMGPAAYEIANQIRTLGRVGSKELRR